MRRPGSVSQEASKSATRGVPVEVGVEKLEFMTFRWSSNPCRARSTHSAWSPPRRRFFARGRRSVGSVSRPKTVRNALNPGALFGPPRDEQIPAGELPFQRVSMDTEQASGLGVVPAGLIEGPQNQLSFVVVGRLEERGRLALRQLMTGTRPGQDDIERQIIDAHGRSLPEHDRPLDHVLEL